MAAPTQARGPSATPTIALVHVDFEGPTGMGLVLNQHARCVLEEGWPLCIVGDNVPDELSDAARVVPVPRPRGLPALPEHVEWCRRARSALRRVDADIVHVHSPLLAARADLHTAHFLARPAFNRGVRETTGGFEGGLRRAQIWAERTLDDALYRRLQSSTYMSFVSEFLRDEFELQYGPPRGGWILSQPAPAWRPRQDRDRSQAQAALGVPAGQVAVGYLGGDDHRKGLNDVLGLASEPDLHLLLAGPKSEGIKVAGRPGLGFVDVDSFLPGCDVVVAPTLFDPAPVAVLQALSRGIPVVTGTASGWAKAIERHGCGVVWRPGSGTLAEACRRAAAVPGENCHALVEELSPNALRENLLKAYERILARDGRPAPASPPLAMSPPPDSRNRPLGSGLGADARRP